MLLLADGALLTWFDKGAYLAFALSACAAAAGAALSLSRQETRRAHGLGLAAAAFPGLALGLGAIALHWGGRAAVSDAALLALGALGAIAVNRLPARPLWQLTRTSVTVGVFGAIVFATVIPVLGSYYLGTRLATAGNDLQVRLRHWNEAFAMMEPDLSTAVFGMGLGRYPDTYFWKNTHGEMPGSYSFQQEADGNRALSLGTPQYANGFGEVLRMLQRVDVRPGTSYRLGLDVRRKRAGASVTAAICERWLIYPQNCVGPAIKLLPADGAWHHYETRFDSGSLGGGGLLRVPTQLELSADGIGASLDVDNVSLVALDTATELVRNGGFSQTYDYWFFSSDRNHFPWHVKNFVVNSYFEMGWLGIASLALLICYVGGALAQRGLHGDLSASVHLAALTAFLLIGLFDSLFDVPRLTLIFFLVLLAAMLAPAAPPARRRVRVRRDRQDDMQDDMHREQAAQLHADFESGKTGAAMPLH